MASQRYREGWYLIWDFGLGNLLEDIKIYISMIYHLIWSTKKVHSTPVILGSKVLSQSIFLQEKEFLSSVILWLLAKISCLKCATEIWLYGGVPSFSELCTVCEGSTAVLRISAVSSNNLSCWGLQNQSGNLQSGRSFWLHSLKLLSSTTGTRK